VAFTWHPGRPAERASHVEVTFAAVGAQTLVWLEHTGWDAFDDPAAARAEYEHGWPLVLDGYQEHLSEQGETWVALLHRPGPAAPRTGSLLEDPRFGSVAGGFLAVTVRPWRVVMQGDGPAGAGA
jgi:Activator of Hsp90 ATPase homolog 1-like protein